MKNKDTLLTAVACLFLCMVHAYAQETGQGRHDRIYAVPLPGKVVIDGKLDDWDLSGQIEMYVMLASREMQSAKFAMMYDDDAVYLGGIVRDSTPLMNRHAPETTGDKAWDADSCQFRMCVDPAQGYPLVETTFGARSKKPEELNYRIKHMLLWYYTDRKEANLQMHQSMRYLPPEGTDRFGVVPRDRFAGAYVKSDDGRGYSFEYRIPWKTLGADNHPKAGDVVAGTVQFNFSRPDGMKTAGISGWSYDVMSGPGFAFQNTGCWGKIIFSEKGNLPRDLVEEGVPPEKPTPLSFEYDLPEDGEVTIALINDRREVVRTIIAQEPRSAGRVIEKWDGLDELGRPMAPRTYAWKGLYHGKITTKFLMSVHNSGQPPYKTDDQKCGWGADHGPPATAQAIGSDVLLAWVSPESGWGIIRVDANGRKKWGSKDAATSLATDGGDRGGRARFFTSGGGGFTERVGVQVFDAADSRPLTFENGLPFLAPPDGADDPAANAVTGLAYHDNTVYAAFKARNVIARYDATKGTVGGTWAVDAPGNLAARADGSILAVSGPRVVLVNDGKPAPFASEHLDQPYGIALDKAGNVYVSNQGSLQNVSVFGPDGTYLRSIGKPGGRPRVGRFDPAGMLSPAGITVDSAGKLWVAEMVDYPKRVSAWKADTGELAAQFFGGAHYSSFIWMDPERPDEVYCDLTIWKVDLDKKTWEPKATFWRAKNENSPGTAATHFGGVRVITARNGRQYAWADEHARGGVFYMRTDDDYFKPVFMFVWTGTRFPIMADPKEYPDGTYPWVDQNDDQIMQKNEISAPIGPSYFRGFSWVDADLNIYHASVPNALKGTNAKGCVYRPIRIEPDGRPVYDFTKPEPLPIGPTYVDPQDGSFYTLRPGVPPGDFIGYARWSRDGAMQWGYRGAIVWPKALGFPPQRPGKLWGPTCPLGVAGDLTGVNSYWGCFHVYTREGIYVAKLFRDPRLGGTTGPDIISSENGNGQLVKPAGMNRYFALGGDQDGRIQEVLGLDTIKRLPGGSYTITAEQAQAVAQAIADYQAKTAKGQRLIIVRGRKALDTAQPVKKVSGEGQAFEARAAYDDKNLYVMYDVTTPNELVNAGPDPRLAFKSGNLLDVQLAADPAAPADRKTPAPGDVRILVSRRPAGDTLAIVYRPKVKGFDGQPFMFKSPTGGEPFDVIEATDRITLDYRRKPGVQAFVAVAAIPLDLIGWQPRPGTKVKMDVGYIFGNAGGTKAMARSYWSNNSFSANVLDDIPNESRLEPQEWGEALVE
ncbi:MAG TPA: hypothetical protein VM223_14325 [Planctomycetota bacterium]|nr:hypothetical protein [Planctomycetota bacterium]